MKNSGISDFCDPKVMRYEPQKEWVMTLTTKDHITFYSSLDLKSWAKESEFGKEIGAHGQYMGIVLIYLNLMTTEKSVGTHCKT